MNDVIKNVHTEEYTEHVDNNSPEWQDLVRRRLDIDGHRCVYCGIPQACTSKHNLAVHHHRYTKDVLNIKDTVSTCQMCHAILGGHKKAYGSRYDPSTPEATKRLEDYVTYINNLIDTIGEDAVIKMRKESYR